MRQHWNEVQPVDSFQVKSKGIIHELDLRVITNLYQPLIGTVCVSLYSVLRHMIEDNRLWSEEWSHYHLMNGLDLNLQEIYEARLKLEAIGLLKTYEKNELDVRTFVYEVQPPLSAEQFFTDGLLNIYLYQKIGKTHYARLRSMFTDTEIEFNEYKEITRSFSDVFQTFGTNMSQYADEMDEVEKDQTFINKESSQSIQVDHQVFDFDLFYSGLGEWMVPKKVMTKQVKDAIANLSYLYGINVIDMQKIMLSSLTADEQVDVEQLRKAARDWYQMEYADQLPQLVDRHQPVIHQSHVGDVNTKEAKLIHYLEQVSPRQLLIDLGDGAQPALSELQAVETIMMQQQLLPGVVNVLIHYVALRTDMRITKSYLEKIASHWARKKVKTVQEAMELAISEHKKYQEWAEQNTKTTKNKSKAKPIRTEKLPEWFKAEQPTDSNKTETVENNAELEAKRKRLEAIQKRYQK